MNRMLILTLIFFPLLNGILAERNRLIRVDGINPTCFERPKCKEFDLIGAVVSVDKSLPYMGSNYCCLTFNMLRLDNYETEGKFMARVLNTTVLEGNDYISFFDADFNIIRNITVDDMEPYTIVYFDTPTVSVEVYKDRNYRSRYEIAFTTYYEPESSLCYKSSLFHRCGPTNKSICIDEELTCDKFEHCPSGNDEEHCGQLNETAVNYDKLTVTIVLSFIMSVIVFTIFSILLLCFFKSNTTLSRAFMSIFGHKNKSQNSAMLEASLKHEQRLSLIADSDTPAKMSYHV